MTGCRYGNSHLGASLPQKPMGLNLPHVRKGLRSTCGCCMWSFSSTSFKKVASYPQSSPSSDFGDGGCLCTPGSCFVWGFLSRSISPESLLLLLYLCCCGPLCIHIKAVWPVATHSETAPLIVDSVIILERFSITCLIDAVYASSLG